MKVIIPNIDELRVTLDQFGCPPAARIQKLIAAIFDEAYNGEFPTCEIKILASLLPNSYTQVPAMLGRALAGCSAYTAVRVSLREKFLIITASKEDIPPTFRAKVMLALKGESRRIAVPRCDVPTTYRQRPDVLARALSVELCETVRAIKKRKTIIWKIK